MAKSLRSKTKRTFRSKKRESGVYAAAAAGRLHRLNSKLMQTIQKDSDGDVLLEEGDNVPGWCWFATFGLLDPNDITLEGLESLTTGSPNRKPPLRARFLDEDSWWFLFTTSLADRLSLTFAFIYLQAKDWKIHRRINLVRERLSGYFFLLFITDVRLDAHRRGNLHENLDTRTTRFTERRMAEIEGDACKSIISWYESPRVGRWKKKSRPFKEEKIRIVTLLYVLLAMHLSLSRTTGQPFGTLRNFTVRTRYVV